MLTISLIQLINLKKDVTAMLYKGIKANKIDLRPKLSRGTRKNSNYFYLHIDSISLCTIAVIVAIKNNRPSRFLRRQSKLIVSVNKNCLIVNVNKNGQLISVNEVVVWKDSSGVAN